MITTPAQFSSANGDEDAHRPSGKVRAFFADLSRRGGLKEGDRLPTAEELAAHLGISSGTVKNVYREWAEEGAIVLRKGIGSFWKHTPSSLSVSRKRRWRVGINVQQAPADLLKSRWVGPFFGGVLKYQMASGKDITLENCGPVLKGNTDRLNGLDGVLALSIEPLPPKIYDATGREVVYVALNPPWYQCTTNFVSPDYYECSRALGAAWRAVGRRRILALNPRTFQASVSSNLRYNGLVVGLNYGLTKGLELTVPNPTASFDFPEEILHAYRAEKGCFPDAIYCGGDPLARRIYEELLRCGVKVPEEVCIVGGSKTEVLKPGMLPLTCMRHPGDEIGLQMMSMLFRRLETGGSEQPGVVLPVPFSIGATTLPEVNALLEEFNRTLPAVPFGDSLQKV